MPRTFTAPQRSAIGASHYNVYAKLELMDSEGNWVDVSDSFDADHLNRIVLEKSIDQNAWTMRAELLREALGTSLAPLMESSPANRDSMDDYAPFLDVSRQWRVWGAILTHGEVLESGDWELFNQGTYDIIDVNSPSPTIHLSGRDLGATLLDAYIEEERFYGDPVNGVPIEDVIQQILNDNIGVGAITLYTPVSPVFLVYGFVPVNTNVMAAINQLAQKANSVVNYRFDASDNFRLTLWSPNRTAVPDDGEEDWELGPSEYLAVPESKLDLSGVRNKIVVRYNDESTGKVETVIAKDDDSIARFGGPHGIVRPLYIDLSKDTNITEEAVAQAFADAILSDLAYPPFMHQYEAPGFWIAQEGDWGKFLANGIHYDVDQFGGVTSIRHTIENGNMRTLLKVGGQPKGRYRTWIADPSKIRGVPQLRISNLREIGRTETGIEFGWDVEGDAREQWLSTSTPAQPVGSNPWPATGAQPLQRMDGATSSTIIPIPGPGLVTYAVLAPIGANSRAGKRWEFTVQGETVKLVQRVTQIASTPTTITVRVEVANPIAAGNATIAYAASNATVSPASGQVLTAASIPAALAATALLATAGSYVDFVITRAVTNGHVVFTSTAVDREPDTDPVVVPALDSIGQGTIAIDNAGTPTAAVDLPLWAASGRYASSTSDFPTEATVISSGTTNNNRQFAATLAHTLALAQAVYVTVIPFSGTGATGVQGASFRMKATRHDFTATKTVYQSFANIIQQISSLTDEKYIEYYASGGYLRNYNWPSTYPGGFWGGQAYLDFMIADGVTVTQFGAELYHAAGASAGIGISVDRMAADGTATNIGSVSTSTDGWQSKTFSCSESTTGRRYRMKIDATASEPMVGQHYVADDELRASVWHYTHSMPSSLNGL
jgi:hypothetical protein